MTDHPIIFSGSMVAALLAGRKSQTRRLATSPLAKCQPRGLLYVRESFGIQGWDEDGYVWVRYAAQHRPSGPLHPADDDAFLERLTNRLDRAGVSLDSNGNYDLSQHPGLLSRPSIHMPRWASRLTLEVMDVRKQRLTDISDDDALAEGMASITKDGRLVKYGIPDRDGLPGTDNHGWPWDQWRLTPIRAFERLWSSLHGADSWAANPDVVAISFMVHRQNVDALLAEKVAA